MKIPPAQIDQYLHKIAGEKIIGCILFGPESSLASYRFDIIAKKIVSDLSDPFLVSTINEESLAKDKAILGDEFFSMSMLGGRKLIVIKNPGASCTAALKLLLEDKNLANSENFILIQAGDLDKNSGLRKLAENNSSLAAIACYEDSEFTIKNFINDELTKRKIGFDREVLDILLEKLPRDRQLILADLIKIETFLGDHKILEASKLEGLIAAENTISLDAFITNFATRKFDISLKQAEKLMSEGADPIMLTRSLSNYLQKMYRAKLEIDLGNSDFEAAVKSQKLFFKTEAEFSKILRTISINFLKKTLVTLENLEKKIKSGVMPPKVMFLAFIQGFLIASKS